jgi:dTDP-4-dehydrorhamnose reductase
MRLAILGAQGQVGRVLTVLACHEQIPTTALGRNGCDITDALAVKRALIGSRIAVNCAAYSAVDQAESDADAAYRVNSRGAANVAAACAELGIPLVHLSTDYVFDGVNDRSATENDPPRPLNVYGHSKLRGEGEIRKILATHIILRTSWIFSAHGTNFVLTMLRLARAQSELRVVNDQIGGPTAADDIARAVLRILDACCAPGFDAWGTYHFSGAPAVSWYDFARAILADCGTRVVPIATKDFPRPARRPPNSVLDCSLIRRVFGIAQPDWHAGLARVREMLAAQCGEPGSR